MKPWISKVGSLLANIFSVGGISLMRILTFFVVGDIMTVWTVCCISAKTTQDIPAGVVGIFIAMVGGKVWQSFSEVKTQMQAKITDGTGG